MTIEQLLGLDPSYMDNSTLLFAYAQCEIWYSKSIPLYHKQALFLKKAEFEFTILDRMRGDWNVINLFE